MRQLDKENTPVLQKIRYSFFKIMTGSDLSRRRLPFMQVKSSSPGPVLWLTACGHGDEVGGMVIIQEIFKKIRKIPLLKGALYAFPLMNPIGFETGSRNITLSKEDLNRSFPGDKNGSLAQRIADKIFRTIIDTDPELVLDLHNDWTKSIPYTVVDPFPGNEFEDVFEKVKCYAGKTGFLVVNETVILNESLSYSLIKAKIPALTIELGESYVVNEANVEFGVKSVLNIMTEMEMIQPQNLTFTHNSKNYPGIHNLLFSHKPVSSTSGIIRFLAKPGDIVKNGKPVARIYNSFGKLQETITAIEDGIVLGYTDSSVAFPGANIMAFAVPGD
ncbi:succinylglutamate desuccinylase/aspartoacylase family protein [candidate division KSB1 bacterium]